MLLRWTLALTTWISLLPSLVSAQSARLPDSKLLSGARSETEIAKPAIHPSVPDDSKSPGGAHVTSNSDASATSATTPAADIQLEKTINAAETPTTSEASPQTATSSPPKVENSSANQDRPKSALPSETARAAHKAGKRIRRDASGKKGVSPFWEAIRRGDDAALVGDLVEAESAYQAAIGIESDNPLAYLRLGQIAVRSSKLERAEAAYNDALRLSTSAATLRATTLFVLADLKERQGRREDAMAAWKQYAELLQRDPKAKGYPETPVERESRIRKYMVLASESRPVRERIELRVKEVEEANRRKAAKNPNANR